MICLFIITTTCVCAVSAVLLTFHFPRVSAKFKHECEGKGGKVLLGDTCYIHVRTLASYGDALLNCQSMSSQLLSLTSLEEVEHLKFNDMLTGQATWLGLTRSQAQKLLTWSDNTTSTLFADQLTDDWELNDGPFVCPIIKQSGMKLEMHACSDEHRYICKSRQNESCYPSWLYDKGSNKCYRAFGTDYDNVDPQGNNVSNLPPLSLNDASAFCQNLVGGHLVTTFFGAFITSGYRFWEAYTKYNASAWVGVFYNNDSKTSFTRDDGTDLAIETDEKLFFVDMSSPSKYVCSYYQSPSNSSSVDRFIKPTSDCSTRRIYFCEMKSFADSNPGDNSSKCEYTGSGGTLRVYWYTVKTKTQIAGRIIATQSVKSRIECAMQCSHSPQCRSFNFKYNSNFICELNTVANETLEEYADKSDYGFLNCS